MSDLEPLDLPLPELARRLRARELRATELAERALARAEASELGGYRVIRRPGALREAAAADATLDAGRDPGPLAGIPVSIKDLYGLPGEGTFAGTSEALPERFEAAGPVVASALRQLAVVTGKTHMVELAFGGIGVNGHWGTPRNPRAGDGAHRVPGGSSSGAGPSLFEGSARIALGTDTAGSVRIPAAWTGHAGLKTTKGRWSTAGIVPLSTTLDTAGILARDVEDLVFGFTALDPRPGRVERREARGLRLALATGVFREDASPGVVEAVLDAARGLEAAGARLEDRALPGTPAAQALFGVGGPTAIELHRFLEAELPAWLERLDPVVQDRLRAAGGTPAGEYIRRRRGLEAAHAEAMTGFEDLDVFITPTVANTPPTVDALRDLDAYRQANLLALRNTGLVSFLGLCALSLPCGVDAAGMPVGLQLIAPAGGEERLLAVAHAVETALALDGGRRR